PPPGKLILTEEPGSAVPLIRRSSLETLLITGAFGAVASVTVIGFDTSLVLPFSLAVEVRIVPACNRVLNVIVPVELLFGISTIPITLLLLSVTVTVDSEGP